MNRYMRYALFTAALVLFATDAAAICPVYGFQVYVGDTASDSSCTYNSIQEALSATYACSTTVRITHEHSYTAQHLTVTGNGKLLTLQGEADGVTCYQLAHCFPVNGCHADTTQPLVTIDGSNTAGSVLTITGNSNIVLRDLTITRGSASVGGGIQFDGTGSLYLDTSTVTLNEAGYGGGIDVNGNGGEATLTLGANSLVISNVAQYDGGGIHLGGSTRLLAVAPYTLIGYNHAPNGNGGGIAMEGVPPIVADIGSPGYNGAPVIEYNDAAYGGGVALIAAPTASPPGTAYDIEMNLFATDPAYPGAISSNSATLGGGGIFLKSNYDSTAKLPVYSGFCATSFNIDGNVAPEGSAIYSDLNEFGGVSFYSNGVSLNPPGGCYDFDSGTNLASLGATTCSGVSCNTLNGNGSLDASSQPTAGAVLYADRGTFLDANRFVMRFNQGGHALATVGLPQANIIDCLLADNTESAELIWAKDTYVDIDSCTMANNSLGGPSVIYSTSPVDPYVDFQDSIIDQPGLVTLNADNHLTVGYVLSNDISTLPFYGTLGTPTYVNAAAGDYHLQLTSLGVDFAPALSYASATPELDLDGKPRTFDIPTVANLNGPRDLGAYERSPACYHADTLYCDGFEGTF